MPLDYNEFAEKIKQKYPEYKNVDNYTLATKMVQKYPEYKNQVVLKKKPTSESGSTSGKLTSVSSTNQKSNGEYTFPGQTGVKFKKENNQWYRKDPTAADYIVIKEPARVKNLEKNALQTTSNTKPKGQVGMEQGYLKKGYQKINNKYYDGKGEIFTNYPGKEGKAYRFSNGQWFEQSQYIDAKNVLANGEDMSVTVLKSPIKDPMRINALNKQFKKWGTSENGVLLGFPGKEQNEYRVVNNQWQRRSPENKTWVNVTNQNSVTALNDYFKKQVKFEPEKVDKLKQDNIYSKNFDTNIKSINSELVGKSQDDVIQELRKRFPAANGWQFDYSNPINRALAGVAAVDRVTVTAPNGQKETFTLDNWTWDDDKRNAQQMIGWMQANNLAPSEKETYDRYKKATVAQGEGAKEEVETIVLPGGGSLNIQQPVLNKMYLKNEEVARQARNEWMPIKSQKVQDIKSQYSAYISDKGALDKHTQERAQAALGALAEDKETIRQVNAYQNDIKYNIESFNKKQKEAELYVTSLNSKFLNGEITKEDFDAQLGSKQKELLDQEQEIKNQIKSSDNLTRTANMAAAENYLVQETKGSLGGGLTLSFIKGMVSPLRLIEGAMGMDTSASAWHKQVTDAIAPIWDYETSLEYLRSEERPDLYKSAFSVAESLGAMAPLIASGGATLLGESALATGTMTAAAFYPMSYYEMKDELENIDMPEEDKIALSSVYGLVSSAFESIGMEYAMGKVSTPIQTAIKRNILKNVVGKEIPKNASKEYIDALVKNETKAYVANLVASTAGSMAVEGGTEALQSLSGAGMKEIYDRYKGNNELFNNEGLQGVMKEALYEGYLGALGGGMTHSVYIASDAVKRGKALNSKELGMLMMAAKTDGMSETLMTNLKSDMLNGRITKTEAEEIANNFQMVRGNMEQMPENLTPEAKSVSLSLMMERDRLNKQIAGKDPNLVKPQTDRVAEINTRLQEISKENAVQEQTTGEVPVQPKTGVGEEVAGGVSQPTTEQVTEEGEQAKATLNEKKKKFIDNERGSIQNSISQLETELENESISDVDRSLAEEIINERKAQLEELDTNPVQYVQNVLEKFPSGPINETYQEFYDVLTAEPTQTPVEETVTTEVAPSTEAELDFEVTPEVTQEADALEKLLADEGITIEAPVVEQPVAEEPVVEETVVEEIPSQPISEMPLTNKDLQSLSQDKINGIYESLPKETREKYFPKGVDGIKPTRFVSNLKSALGEVKAIKAIRQEAAPVAEAVTEEAPVAEAKPAAKPKAAKKLTVKEIVQKYNDHIDSLIKAEKEKSDRRIVQLENQKNSATGQRRTELTQEILDLEFAFKAKKRGLESKKDDKKAAKDFNDQGNIKPADILFQLDSDQETTDRKQELLDIATAMMEEAEKEGLSETAFTAEQPEPQVDLITIDIKENTELANKVKRMGFSELIGKKINLVMADQLKVGKGLMGGPFFPLINKLFGKVAWASINDTAAIKIINGAIKSDYTVVYNMKPEAIDSNVAVLDSFEQKIKALPAKIQKQVFTELTEYLNEKKFGEKTDDIRKMASESKNLNEFLTKLNELDVDTIAAVVKSVLPSKTVNAGTKIGATLQSQNISIEDIRAENIEQFVADLPAGALTMVLQVTDKNGNKVTKQTAREALISREQQKAEGLPTHKNYPVYIRGKAVGILKETTQFWNVFKDSLNEINVKVAGIVKHSTGRSLTSKEAISNEMRSASMTASQARNVMEPTVDMYKKFVSLLSRSIPGVTVVTSQQEFNDLLDNLNVQKLSTKTQKVYGAVYNGKIYLNPSLQNYNTPIHEFGHIWLNVTKTANKELYNKGIDLIKGSEYVDQIKNNKDYQRVINEMINNGATQEEVDNYIYEEALATAIGDKGESFVKASQALKDFKTWLDKLYSFVRKITGISKYTPEQLQDISLDEFLQAVSVDLLSGEKLFDVTEGSMSDALQLMSKSDDISKIVDIAAKNGVSNEAVKVLLARRGFSISDINAALVKKAAPIKKGSQKKVTVNEKTALKDQIRFEARAARDAKKDLNEKRKDLAKTISDMETTGKITTKQAQALMARISKLNMDNPAKVDAFIEYAGRVFENAEFAQDVARANSLKSKVKANAKTKLGIANDLISEILVMASINPSLIPSKVFDTYMETMEMLGQRAAVLKLEERGELTQKVADILDAVNEELSVASEMAERFEAYDKKEFDSEGKVEFAKTLDKMVADGTITKEDADIMRKYKSEIVDKESTKMTEEELEAEKKSLIEVLKKDTISDEAIGDLPSRLERDLAEAIKSLLKTDAVKSLDNTTLKNLLKLVDNINNGFVPHYAQVIKERLTAIDNAPTLETSIKKGNPLRVGSFTGRIKSLFTKRNYVLEMIRSTSLGNIDQVFGDFKTNNIFKSLFESSAKGIAAFNSQLGVIQDKLEKAKQDVAKSLRKDPNRVTMSSFKTMTYLLQLEKDSNPDSKQVNNAVDFINATIDQIEKGASSYTEMDAEFLQEILDTYTKDGKLDINKLYNSFNATEKAAIKTIQEVNDSMTEKAVYTAGIIRGDKINPIANYVPHVVLEEAVPGKEITGANDVANFSNSRKPSTKAKNLVERTGAVTAISFDPYQTTQNAAKNVLLDFHMTEPIRTARMTINETRKRLEENGITPEQRIFLNAINNSYEEATQNVLANSFQQNELLNKVVEYIAKAGYKAVLGTSITRTASELGSNFAAVVFMNPKAFGRGVSEFSNYSNPEEGLDIMLNVGSAQTERVMGGNTQGGMLVDPAISKRAVGMKDTKAKNKLASTMQMLYNISLKHPANWVDATSDVLMSSPDTIVTRPTWFGAFANEFEKVAGKKVDFDKIKANDEAYINENKNAIESARKKADKSVFNLSATNNMYMGLLKNNISPDSRGIAKALKVFDNYLTRFTTYEYLNARTAIYALFNQGMIGKKEATGLLLGVTTRMIAYSLLTKTLFSLMFGGDDEDDDKSFMQKLGQAGASAATTLLLGRNFGNIARNVMGYGAEKINEKYLTALREGEYDAYQDAIQYTVLPQEKKSDMGKGVDVSQMFYNMLGPTSPFVKSFVYGIEKFTEQDRVAPKSSDSDAVKAKRKEAVLRQQRERNIRVPLEVTGTLGLVPFYKDIRRAVNDWIYSDLKKSLKEQEVNKKKKEEMLMGYESKSEMEEQNPKLYERLYGEDGKYYAQEEVRLANENFNNKLKEIKKDLMKGDINPSYANILRKEARFNKIQRIKQANR